MTVRELFIIGVARSGTNLVARMLDLHPQVDVVLDALLPVFRELRDAVAPWAAGGPLPDYYGPGGPPTLAAALAADLGRAIDRRNSGRLADAVATRARLEAADLEGLQRTLVHQTTFAEVIQSVLGSVLDSRGGPATRWVAAKEVWTVEYVPALARAFPEAKFVLVERDPRAVLASLLAMGRRDATQQAHTVSYLRHWRKHVALAWFMSERPELSGRLARVGYERLVKDPDVAAEQLAAFLELDDADRLVALSQAPDRVVGGAWAGNSSYGPLEGFDAASVDRWREELDAEARATAECLCAPEWRLSVAGSSGMVPFAPDAAVLRHFIWADAHSGSWRSDGGSVAAALELERRRYAILSGSDARADAVEECFLSAQVLDAVRAAG